MAEIRPEGINIKPSGDSPGRLRESFPLYVTGTFSNQAHLDLVRFFPTHVRAEDLPVLGNIPAMGLNLVLGVN